MRVERPARPRAKSHRRVSATRGLPPPRPVLVATRRGFGLGFWATLLAGAWIGRASVSLPAGLDQTFDVLLPMGAAAFVFLSYRRWIRTRLAASAAARQRAAQRAGVPRA